MCFFSVNTTTFIPIFWNSVYTPFRLFCLFFCCADPKCPPLSFLHIFTHLDFVFFFTESHWFVVCSLCLFVFYFFVFSCFLFQQFNTVFLNHTYNICCFVTDFCPDDGTSEISAEIYWQCIQVKVFFWNSSAEVEVARVKKINFSSPLKHSPTGIVEGFQLWLLTCYTKEPACTDWNLDYDRRW